MTLNIPDKADGPSRVLFNALADISMSMMTICENLGSNPAVIAATRGCDLRRYQGSMLGEEFSSFEAYVEAETRAGALFCWSLEIDQTSLGWTFERQVSKQARDFRESEIGFFVREDEVVEIGEGLAQTHDQDPNTSAAGVQFRARRARRISSVSPSNVAGATVANAFGSSRQRILTTAFLPSAKSPMAPR